MVENGCNFHAEEKKKQNYNQRLIFCSDHYDSVHSFKNQKGNVWIYHKTRVFFYLKVTAMLRLISQTTEFQSSSTFPEDDDLGVKWLKGISPLRFAPSKVNQLLSYHVRVTEKEKFTCVVLINSCRNLLQFFVRSPVWC